MSAPFRGTSVMTTIGFETRLARAKPGEEIIYAIGNLAVSADRDPKVFELRAVVQAAWERGDAALTQRPCDERTFALGGRAFEYLATKRKPKTEGTESAGT